MRRSPATLARLLLLALLHASGAAFVTTALASSSAATSRAADAALSPQPPPLLAEQASSARAEKSAALLVPPASPAAVIVRKIDPGLAYIRAAQRADGELVPPGEPQGDHADLEAAFVFDLRYAAGGSREAEELGDWLAKWAAAGVVPIFILVNAETAPALGLAAAQFAQAHAALLIGPANDAVPPDIVLPIDPAQERAAYVALTASDAEPATLIGEGVVANKPRYDEAAVIAAHTEPASRKNARRDNDNDKGGDSNAATPTAPQRGSRRSAPRESATQVPQESAALSAEDGSASPIDLSLQRAIYLHRAWRALKLHP